MEKLSDLRFDGLCAFLFLTPIAIGFLTLLDSASVVAFFYVLALTFIFGFFYVVVYDGGGNGGAIGTISSFLLLILLIFMTLLMMLSWGDPDVGNIGFVIRIFLFFYVMTTTIMLFE